MPNFFAFAYYKTFGHNEMLPDGDIDELNAFLRKYLDDNFMLSFIEDVKKGVVYSFEKSIEKKKDVIELIRANRAAYVEGEPDKKLYKATAKVLSEAVKDSIDKLAIIKDSTAYTFEPSLYRAIDTYFSAIPNNVKEQKRYDKESKKIDKITARGKTPDYKVVPAKSSIWNLQGKISSRFWTRSSKATKKQSQLPKTSTPKRKPLQPSIS